MLTFLAWSSPGEGVVSRRDPIVISLSVWAKATIQRRPRARRAYNTCGKDEGLASGSPPPPPSALLHMGAFPKGDSVQ